MSRKTPTSLSTGSKSRTSNRNRDYRAEYAARISRGLASGKSRSAARGHPRAIDLPTASPSPVNRNDPRERALRLMRQGASQAQAAKIAGVTVEQVRRYREINTTSIRQGQTLVIFDTRPQEFRISTDGKMKIVTLANDDGSAVGRYWTAVNEFLATNDIGYLQRLTDEGVRDINGRFWRFELRPNVLRKLDSIGELQFTEIYADVAK